MEGTASSPAVMPLSEDWPRAQVVVMCMHVGAMAYVGFVVITVLFVYTGTIKNYSL